MWQREKRHLSSLEETSNANFENGLSWCGQGGVKGKAFRMLL